jgi:cytochrome b subunit of formate dehydrogenase
MLIITGGLPFFNWFILEMHIYNLSVPELAYSSMLHSATGIIFIFTIIFYMFNHLKFNSNIISEKPYRDVKSFYNSLFYLIGITRKKEVSEGDLYLSSQKILFLLYVYSSGLIIMSGLTLLFSSITGTGGELQSFENGIFVTHILSVLMFILLALFQIGSILRNLDKVALKSILVNGKVPMWYMKKYHTLWYSKLLEGESKQK